MTLKSNQTKHDLSLFTIGWTGSLAGVVLWASCYPMDLLKTKLQTENFENPRFKGLWDVIRGTYKEAGLKGFFKGFVPCLTRAVPVNGGILVVFEMFERSMTKPKV